MERTIAVMARPLVGGAVKTRLAPSLGDAGALAVYRRLLDSTLTAAERVEGVTLVLAEAASGQAGQNDGVLAGRDARWLRLPQHGTGLGERLANVFDDLFRMGADAVVVTGSDSPELPSEYIEQAFRELPRADLVLGPAADGGYYLIASVREVWEARGDELKNLVRSGPMSTPRLFTHTLRAAQAAGLRVAQLPLWVDVDEPADLAVAERLAGAAPRRGEPLEQLREVYLHVTHRCGRRCRHCYDAAVRSDDELGTDEWIDVIDQCVALGAGSFVFIGGDPLMRDDFLALLDHVTGSHQARARFFFNCLIDAALAEELGRAGRGMLTPLVSIDGPRGINDALRGDGSHADVMASIANLHAAGLDPVANTVLVRPVLPGLPQLARELHAAGVKRLHLILPHQRSMSSSAADELVPSGEELLAAFRGLASVAGEIGLVVDNLPGWRRRIGKRNDLCAAGCRDLSIDPEGQVYACVITAGDPAFAAGSLRDGTLSDIWRGSAALRLLRASRARDRIECSDCPVVDACGGECWVQAHYAARTREEAAGYRAAFPYCDLVRPLLQEMAAGLTTEAGADPADACAAAGACGGQSAAGTADFTLFDCI